MSDAMGKQIIWEAQETVSDLQSQTDLLLRNHHDIIVLVNTTIREVHGLLESISAGDRDVEDLRLYLSEWKSKLALNQQDLKGSSSSLEFILISLQETISKLEETVYG